jgi:O-antigen ligase
MTALESGRQRLMSHPFGTGLGSTGPVSLRFEVTGSIITESWYLQVATQTGIVGGLAFVFLVGMVLLGLWQRARNTEFAIGPLCALVGVALGGLVLHTFEEPAVAWAVWVFAGLSLRDSGSNRAEGRVTSSISRFASRVAA